MKNNLTNRINNHPILTVPEESRIYFYFNQDKIQAQRGEVISSALIANGIHVFSHHHKDHSSQGIFCANGQCAKCTVIANGMPVKACMTKVTENMIVNSINEEVQLPDIKESPSFRDNPLINTSILIIGGGPAGLSAALELARHQIDCIILDDKSQLGGKLVLQTHKFFGSVKDSFAGTRGNDIGKNLSEQVYENKHITVLTDSTALFVFKDQKIGVIHKGQYQLIQTKILLNTAGAREKFLRFPGNTLTGIYGAGAFQTLVNRDYVRPSQKLFVVGGGNVGLIAAYHALQAGIEVVGLVEAMPKCGGYKVHADKLKRLGIPIHTSHTVVRAEGKEHVERVVIAECDQRFQIIPNTEKTYECDTLLMAVGLEPINEFQLEAEKSGIPCFSAGDAHEIAEASSAMFNGMIAGYKVAQHFNPTLPEVPQEWIKKSTILKSHPGKIYKNKSEYLASQSVFPVIHCIQEIPCNPCQTSCPEGSIRMENDPILGIPYFTGKCTGCAKCLKICPGLAITIVDKRKSESQPTVIVPYEIMNYVVNVGDTVTTVDIDGNTINKVVVLKVVSDKTNRMQLVHLQTTNLDEAMKTVSFKLPNYQPVKTNNHKQPSSELKTMVCLCERIEDSAVKELIKKGVTDMNQIKAITRAGMGSCGGKSCSGMVRQLMIQEGVSKESITPYTSRPVYVEVTLGVFAGVDTPEAKEN